MGLSASRSVRLFVYPLVGPSYGLFVSLQPRVSIVVIVVLYVVMHGGLVEIAARYIAMSVSLEPRILTVIMNTVSIVK